MGGQSIDPGECAAGKYGPSTTAAVVAFKRAHNIFNYQGAIDNIVGKKTIALLDQLLSHAQPPAVFIVHDVRLFGWRPGGDVLEVNGDTPLNWVINNVVTRGKANGGNLVLKIMAHGLPGFVQCARGALLHPTLQDVYDPNKDDLYIGPGNGGISIADLRPLSALKGHVRRIEFHSCLVARMGPCFEANGHVCYDGNAFCYQLAQVTGAEVRASIHLQYYWKGSGPNGGMHFGTWNGRVFTWGPLGNITAMDDFPYKELEGPPPPDAPPL